MIYVFSKTTLPINNLRNKICKMIRIQFYTFEYHCFLHLSNVFKVRLLKTDSFKVSFIKDEALLIFQ